MTKSATVFLDNLEEYLGNRTAYWLAKTSGLSQATISRILGKKMVPALESVDAIAKALEINPWIMVTPKAAKKTSIPPDILKMLENQPDVVYQTVRGMLQPLTKTKGKR